MRATMSFAGVALFAAYTTVAASYAQPADPCAPPPDGRSANEAWTTRSWTYFNRGDYQSAIANVDACLANWEDQASKLQAGMDAKKKECPPVGAVDEATRKAIHNNGLLNDVATNLWIKARSYHSQGNIGAARNAYEACARLRCARTWDPKGWFWDPAGDCASRVKRMN